MTGKLEDTIEIDRQIGERIQGLRKSKGLSRKELARSIHITHQQLHKYEAGINRISASRLLKLCEAIDVSIAQFFEQPVLPAMPKRGVETLAKEFVALPEGHAKVAVLTLMGKLVECNQKSKENIDYPGGSEYISQPDGKPETHI